MIIVTCRVYPKDIGLSYKEESYVFGNSHQLKDFLFSLGNVIVDKVFEIKEEEEEINEESM